MRDYRIEFDHPDYTPMDPMPFGMNMRVIKAVSVENALAMFKIRYEVFANSRIKGVSDITDRGLHPREEENWESIKKDDLTRYGINVSE